jgi:DNA-binding response OmpR family regulator
MNETAAQRGPVEVLVVDDNVNVSRALGEMLFRQGFAPVVCTTGQDAMSYLDQAAAPGAAVIDVHLPDVSGLTLTQHLRQRHGPDVPVIILSGDTSMENLSALPLVGATYFYSKPVRGSELLERIRELTTPCTQAPADG